MTLKVVSASNAAFASYGGFASNNSAAYARHVAAIISLRLQWLIDTQVPSIKAGKEDKESQTFRFITVNKQGDAA